MNDGNETAWSVIWGIALIATLAMAPSALSSPEPGGVAILVLLAGEVFMLALPSLWEGWKRGRPRRERARAAARERAAAHARLRAEQGDARRERQGRRTAQRDARMLAAQEKRDALAARQEAEAYYRAHAALLEDVLPPALFRAEVASAFPSSIGPEAAWQASRDLITRMQPLVRQARERHREEQERERQRAEQIRDIDEQIRAAEARIRSLRATRGPDADFVEDEIATEREGIERLRGERAALLDER